MPVKPVKGKSGVQKSLAEIDLAEITRGKHYNASPSAWDDEVLYFLMLDRFSDGREFGGFSDSRGKPVPKPSKGRTTPLYDPSCDAASAPEAEWFEAGKGWCGGTIAGLKDKIGYLSRLGVTAVWVSPVFRQVTGSGDYHGYGIQNFLDVDPHFGTRQELCDFVAAAHKAGIRVILDIILNHAGDVYAYRDNQRYFYYEGQQWEVGGYRSGREDNGSIPFDNLDDDIRSRIWPDGAIWPVEFQAASTWSRQGEIRNWDAFPEYLDGDFCSLKDIDLGSTVRDPETSQDLMARIARFVPSATLDYLVKVYRYWIALTDIDGFRLDTVKHMEPGAVRYFATGIHEFAQSIGKENFAIIGEITGGRSRAIDILDATGLDAALGIDDLPDKLEFLAKGYRSPGNPETTDQEGYFDMFMNSLLDGKSSHQWYSKHIVTMIDDHDQVGQQHKYRFCGDSPESPARLKLALGLNLATAGIPCIYYGTEQAFDGADRRCGDDSYSDVFLRECMFGGPFGTHRSRGRHFFDESHDVYRFVGRLSGLRQREVALRRGRQYLRQVSASGDEGDFWYPQPVDGKLFWVVAWSRIFATSECLCAINTSLGQALTVSVVVDRKLHEDGRPMSCLFSTDESQEGTTAGITWRDCGATVRITVPPGGFVVYR
ncbi:MAG TPA: alpha-amylase family glycosyl hydrolase [Chlorobaculum sp.]|nr:alpha-amylase family glycosyl hydrolase [Chlorobaculum sp.]